MKCGALELKHNLIRTLVIALLLPLLYSLPLTFSETFLDKAVAEDSTATFKAKFTSQGIAQSNLDFVIYSENKGTETKTTSDSNGEISVQVSEGYNYVYLRLSDSQSTQFVNSSLYVIVKGGVIATVKKFSGASIDEIAGIYQVSLNTPNVLGKLTLNGIAASGFIKAVIDSKTNKWVSFESVGPNSSGDFGLFLNPGIYEIFVNPYNEASIIVECVVPSSGTVNCDANAPPKNLILKIKNKSNQLLTENAYAYTIDSKIGMYSYLPYNNQTGLISTGLKDGKYTLVINSSSPDIDGMSRSFRFSVNNGEVSDLIDTITDETISKTSEPFELQLAAPNFVGIVKANGVVQNNVWSYASQKEFWQYSVSQSDGKIQYRLPNGENTVTIYPNSSDTQSVSSVYTVVVSSGSVTSVKNTSGTSISATDGKYELTLSTPNLQGKITKNGVGAPGEIWGVWNTVNNDWAKYQARYPSGTGDFGILVPAGNYDVLVRPSDGVFGLRNCQASASVVNRCDFNFPADNFKVDLKNYAGTKVNNDVSVILSPTTVTGDDLKIYTFPFRYEYSAPQDKNGTFSTSLLDGEYFMRIDTTDSLGIGVARYFDLKVETGTVTSIIDRTTAETITVGSSPISISFANPNFKLRVKTNGVSAPGLWYWGYNLGKGDNEGLYGNTDRYGAIVKNLKDGIYQFTVNPNGQEDPFVIQETIKVTVESGTVTSIINSTNDSVTATSGIFEINLPAANVTGSIKLNGSTNYSDYLYPSGTFDLDKNQWIGTNSTYRIGKYGAKLPVGHYALFTTIYGKGMLVSDCQVTNTSSNVCDFEASKDNFIFKITDPSGVDLLSDVAANLNLDIENFGGTGSWLEMQSGGLFKSTLQKLSNMTFRVNVYSQSGTKNGTPRSYKITMSGETVTAVADFETGVAVTKDANGVWPLKLGQPNISGTVVADDASNTPVPNTSVRAQGPQYYWMSTDNTGYFATTVNMDGTYRVWATAPDNDMSKADSARTEIKVINGVGNSNIQLKLRVPNVKGVVSGPVGNSKYNYIQVLKQDDYGNFQYLGEETVTNRSTDAQGNFAFYLEPGTYRFAAQSDEKFAGGAATTSGDCVVTSITEVKTCSFSLQSFNLKIQLKSLANLPYLDAWTYFSWDGNKDGSETQPNQTWHNSSPNESGEIKFALGNGQWRGRIEIYGTGNESAMSLLATVESGQITSLTDGEGNAFTKDASTGIYTVQLSGSNLTGSITLNGKSIDYGAWVNVLKSDGEYYEYVGSKWANAGKYALKVKPGTYIVEVYPYPYAEISTGSPVRTRLSQCVVPESGNVVCDVALSTGNLIGEIITPSGDIVNWAGAYILKTAKNSNGEETESWDQGLNVTNGKFNALLENGTYRLWVSPDWKSSGKYTYRNYEIIVETSTVQSVKDLTTNTLISKVGSKYQFKLGAPSLTGTVLMPTPSTAAVPNVMVSAQDASSGEILWKYQSWSNSSGEFSMSLPDGTYDLVARTWGSGYSYTTSAKTRVTINNSGTAATVEIRMRSPNLTGRVVSPDATPVALANISVNGWFGDQYFYAVTDAQGYFGAYIDSSTVTCPASCSINLYPNKFGKYVSKTHSISAIGNVGDLALGKVNTKVTVLTPTNGGTGIPNRWAWVMVTEMQPGNNTVISRFGASSNELGVAGLDLAVGHHYQLTAYPSWEFYGQYAPKTYEIASYNATTHAEISITFESPNVTLVVQDKDRKANAWGWFEISRVNGASYEYYVDSYLNEVGRAATYLPEGNYKIHIYPGKGAGVETEAIFNVSASGVLTSTDSNVTINSNNVAIFRLATGNVSGTVFASDGTTKLGNIPVSAIKTSDSSTVVSTVTRKDGSFELNLNVTFDWTIKALNPDDLKTGSTNISATSPSNAILTNNNITLATPSP